MSRARRLSACSRPAGSNHSCRVWAPPPVPPEPSEIASSPSESGMLASVEARRSLRLDSKVGVDGADGGEQRRGRGQLSGRTLADDGDGGIGETVTGLAGMRLGFSAGFGNGAAKLLLECHRGVGIGGAQIDLDDGALGNGVDGRAAFDAADVERGAGIDGQRDAEERRRRQARRQRWD